MRTATLLAEPLTLHRNAHGLTVRAGRPFRPGDVVLHFGGSLHAPEELVTPYDVDHALQIGPRLFLGPTGGAPDDFVNHGCDPNTGVIVRGVAAHLVAVRPIAIGEEITYDYSTTMVDAARWEIHGCLCGAKGCRGDILDFRTLPPHVRVRYAALGIVPEYALRSAGMIP